MRVAVLPALALVLIAASAFAQPQATQPPAAPLPRGYVAFGAPPPTGPSPGLSAKAFGGRVYKLSFKAGDDVMGGMARFAAAHPMQQAQLSGVGGVSKAVLAWYDPRARAFREIPVMEKCEISGVTGTITTDAQGKPNVHLHLVLSRKDGSTVSGHLISATVDPVLEVFVTDLGAGKDVKVP